MTENTPKLSTNNNLPKYMNVSNKSLIKTIDFFLLTST